MLRGRERKKRGYTGWVTQELRKVRGCYEDVGKAANIGNKVWNKTKSQLSSNSIISIKKYINNALINKNKLCNLENLSVCLLHLINKFAHVNINRYKRWFFWYFENIPTHTHYIWLHALVCMYYMPIHSHTHTRYYKCMYNKWISILLYIAEKGYKNECKNSHAICRAQGSLNLVP